MMRAIGILKKAGGTKFEDEDGDIYELKLPLISEVIRFGNPPWEYEAPNITMPLVVPGSRPVLALDSFAAARRRKDRDFT